MNILHIGADNFGEYNSQHWRTVIPCDALNKIGHHCHISNVERWMRDENRERASQADLIIVERILVEEAIARADFWHKRGKPVVIDIDDSYSRLQPFEQSGNQASRFWQAGIVDVHYPGGQTYEKKLDVSPLEQFRKGLQICSGLTMPSRILAEDWQPYAPTWIIPNYIDAPRYLPQRKPYKGVPDELIIGWGGSMSHKLSFERSGVAQALQRVLKRHPKVKFMLCGDNRILDIIKLPPQQVIFRNYVTYSDWPMLLKQFDIGIAPLQGKYDHSRSFIKSMEYSTMGIPFVATGCPTYEEFEAAGIGLYVADSEEHDGGTIMNRAAEWEKKLEELIIHYDDHKKLIDNQFEKSQYWWVENRTGDILKTYEAIIAHG